MTLPVPGRLTGLALLLVALLPGCTTAVEGEATPAPARPTPASPEELEALLVTEVPSDLPRVPDEHLTPPAGEKSVDDVAGYADDPEREREILEHYGYRYGWERFWGGAAGALTSVFVDQFDDRAGAGAYARDLAANEAEYYDGVLREDPPRLPGGCRLLTVEDAHTDSGLTGPAAFAWCGHGVFSVAVTAVGGSVEEAMAEVHAVVEAQLERLPPS
ncbi:hypothetical protein [Geodermatophilus ruber]|uniref:PknH-like extracellular domain-containing protein n=1 Tax=Geodermatophilus ruber TaxID=504800 RepID=A0A1I4I4K9_9ACTN|nr:hypothetical protein [Geodermatophilus ruber]SFL48666.1 hypothetical protein SAMN04488085_11210 [Geodermatophilus ruber]